MKFAAFFILVKSTAAAEEPETGSEIFCPLRFQIMPVLQAFGCNKWMECSISMKGIVQECEPGSMFNKNTRECDETCTPEVCCVQPDLYVALVTESAPTTTTVSTTSTEVSTETQAVINCLENNGGCSHYCNALTNQCECPTCWVLGDDGITCDIDQTKIEVTCSDTGFDIEVDECIFIGDSDDTVTIGFNDQDDISCSTLNSTAGIHSIQGGLDSCGTEASYGDDGKLYFNNILEVTSRQFSNGLVFNNEATIPVSCSFETEYHTDLKTFGIDQNDVQSGVVEGASAPATSFSFDLTLTSDHQLIDELPEGYSRVIGDMNYFKIAPQHLPTGIEFEVTKCTVHDNESNSFDIISDSCPSQIVQGQLINGNPVSTIFGMGYRTFLFNSHESETDLSLSCDIVICTAGMCPENSC